MGRILPQFVALCPNAQLGTWKRVSIRNRQAASSALALELLQLVTGKRLCRPMRSILGPVPNCLEAAGIGRLELLFAGFFHGFFSHTRSLAISSPRASARG